MRVSICPGPDKKITGLLQYLLRKGDLPTRFRKRAREKKAWAFGTPRQQW